MNENDLTNALMDLNRAKTPYRFFFANEDGALYVEPLNWNAKLAAHITDLKKVQKIASKAEIELSYKNVLNIALSFLKIHGIDLSDYE